MTVANQRASSAERERMKIEADMKSQHEADARQIEHLRNQAQLAEVQLKAQQEFVSKNENIHLHNAQREAQILAQTLADNVVRSKEVEFERKHADEVSRLQNIMQAQVLAAEAEKHRACAKMQADLDAANNEKQQQFDLRKDQASQLLTKMAAIKES